MPKINGLTIELMAAIIVVTLAIQVSELELFYFLLLYVFPMGIHPKPYKIC
jgi:hypothetical protein